jgi:uncharacterized protein (DUF58 family)
VTTRTSLGRLVEGAGWLSIALGLTLGTLAPAFVGFALLSYAHGARRVTAGAALTAERQLPERANLDESITVETSVETSRAVPVRVTDRVPVGARVLSRERDSALGRGEQRVEVLPEETGRLRWREVDVDVLDPWGLHEQTRTLVHESVVQVRPELAWGARGRQQGQRHPAQAEADAERALEEAPEIEFVREYQPGDRLRDIDWARTSRMPDVFVRQCKRMGPRPLIVLLDATSSMRWRRRTSKLSTASRLAYALIAAGQSAGVQASLVAFNETRVRQAGSGSRGRAIAAVLEELSDLQAREPVGSVHLAAEGSAQPSEAERAFLKALSPFVSSQAPASTPLESALSVVNKRSQSPARVVAVLDAEQNPQRARVAVRRLGRSDHDVLLVVPATGAHHYTRREAQGDLLDRLVEAHKRRERLTRDLDPLDVETVALVPGGEDAVLEEVVEWIQ